MSKFDRSWCREADSHVSREATPASEDFEVLAVFGYNAVLKRFNDTRITSRSPVYTARARGAAIRVC
jgi:hypothetical protein